jgi:hypothetical protein
VCPRLTMAHQEIALCDAGPAQLDERGDVLR